MDLLHESIADLRTGFTVIPTLVAELPATWWRRRPADGGWTILEVVNHLWDEERKDFRPRLQMVLRDPDQSWPDIDPQGWVTEKRYNDTDPEMVLRGFQSERRQSLEWLEELMGGREPEWSWTYQHPKIGPMSARRIILSWRAHDLLHTRQLLRLRWEFLQAEASAADVPGGLGYAGIW